MKDRGGEEKKERGEEGRRGREGKWDEQTDRWTDRQMDRWRVRQTCYLHETIIATDILSGEVNISPHDGHSLCFL